MSTSSMRPSYLCGSIHTHCARLSVAGGARRSASPAVNLFVLGHERYKRLLCSNHLFSSAPSRTMFTSLIVTTVLAALAIANPAPRALPSGDVTCGSNVYTVSEVSAAVSGGVAHRNDPIGSDSYPHGYFVESSEHITLFCSGSSFLEYPILPKGVAYSGGSPGADRVVFTTSGTYCAVVTHTGAATEDGFTACKGD
ncbi:Ribonuclease/ribotoxin [Mycena metata]|uniref:Ribonuclease/ribotoxin n=1 Tax=Mycena metata TaxID=1033252 RepID=A0AAD7I2J3_9AGAR|nr:Ribonuclease/ribotoxin [Mycena metata]